MHWVVKCSLFNLHITRCYFQENYLCSDRCFTGCISLIWWDLLFLFISCKHFPMPSFVNIGALAIVNNLSFDIFIQQLFVKRII